jgi:hypothetical protein
MAKDAKCVLCEGSCSTASAGATELDLPIYTYECSTCGSYTMTHQVRSRIQARTKQFYVVSAVTRAYWDRNSTPLFVAPEMFSDDPGFESHFLSHEPKSVHGKIDLLMRYIARLSSKPGDIVQVVLARDYPVAFCKDENELQFYVNHLVERGLLALNTSTDAVNYLTVTVDGWTEVNNMATPNGESKQAFVAMWFDDSMNEVFDKGIKPLEKETGFSMFRVDKAQFINEKICDKIIVEIRRSRFLVVDVSGHRNAVYYEAGYATGMGLPVIWTCRKADSDGCSFDSRQYNHIFWQDVDDLRTQLGERILATIGKA